MSDLLNVNLTTKGKRKPDKRKYNTTPAQRNKHGSIKDPFEDGVGDLHSSLEPEESYYQGIPDDSIDHS